MTVQRRAFGYVRVSVDEEDGNNASIASQSKAIANYCALHQLDLVMIYEEPNVSGTKVVRKQFDRMIAAAIAPEHPVDVLVVFALSRFARRMVTQVVAEAKLDAAGVELLSLTEAFTNDATGRMMRGVIGLMNEKYANDAALFTRRDRRQNASNGFFNGGNVPFGYVSRTVQVDGKKERKKLFIVDDEAAIVRRIYDLAEGGEGGGPLGTRSIAEWLRTRGYTLRGRPFFHGSLDRILTQPQYLGGYLDRTKDNAGRLPSLADQISVACPRIIEPEQAARVAALRASRAPAVTAPRIVNGPTLLTGLAACGMPGCSSGLTIATGKGGRYRYYKCAGKVNGGATRCTCPTLPEKALDDIVIDAVGQRVLQPARLKKLLSNILEVSDVADARRRADLDQARKAKTRADTALRRLLELVEEGLMSAKDPVFAQRMAERRKEQSDLMTAIAGLERQTARGSRRITPDLVGRFGELLVDKLRSNDPALRKSYVRLLVDRVEVSTRGICISGSKAALEHAILSTNALSTRVPSFDREWCPGMDSNHHIVTNTST